MASPIAATSPSVVALFIGPTPEQPLHAVDQVVSVAGHGLEGDRKFRREGVPDRKNGPDREVTLIEAEAIEAVSRDYAVELSPVESQAQRRHAGRRAQSPGRQAVPGGRGPSPGHPAVRAVLAPGVADATRRERSA